MNEDIISVGVDDGHDSIKTCAGYDHDKREYVCSTIKSSALSGLYQLMQMSGEAGAAYSTSSKDFTIAENTALGVLLDTRSLDYPISPLNRVLVNHALIKQGLGGKRVSIATGLPVDQYYQDGKPNDDLIEQKSQNLLGSVISHNGNNIPAIVEQSKVMSEGIAAFFDVLMNEDGSADSSIKELIKRKPITVVDLGGKTLDIATIAEGGKLIYSHRSGTFPIGVIDMKQDLGTKIKSKYKLNNDPPMPYVDEAFLTSTYEIFDKAVDMTDLISERCAQYVSEIQNAFLRKVGDGSDIGAVIFVGGGTSLLKHCVGEEIFKNIFRGKIIIPAKPEYANARGMWKWMHFTVNSSQKKIQSEAA